MLVVLTTHPIQYQVPIWKALSQRGRTPFQVLYLSDQGYRATNDPGFGRNVAWDIDLLDGYDYRFIDPFRTGRSDSFCSLTLRPGFSRWLAELGAKVLWVQGWQVAAYWQAVFAAHAIGVEVWLRGETNSRSASAGLSGTAKKVVLRRLFARVDRFLSIGRGNREFYVSQGVSPTRISATPYCVDNARFRVGADRAGEVRSRLREQWRIPPDAFCLLFVGKFIEKKRPLDIVRAAGLLTSRGGCSIHLLFVGSGPLERRLREAVDAEIGNGARHGTRTRSQGQRLSASFTGFLNQSEIGKAYAAADCLVLPSDAGETWGLVVNEAMASGLPCIVSDACGCADDLVRPIRPDLCFPVGDVVALASSVKAVMADPPPRPLLEEVIDRFDYIHTVEAVEELYSARTSSRIALQGELAFP